jgi:DNA modification methylase
MTLTNEPNHDFHLNNSGYSNYENTTELPRHRWYYYKEGFSPLLVEKAIEHVGIQADNLIIDPFNGSGTTTLTAALEGYKAIGIEVNPFTAFLSIAKIRNLDTKHLDNWKPSLLEGVMNGLESKLVGFSTFSETEKLNKWLFNESVLKAFEGGWNLTETLPSYNLKKLFQLALISSAMQNCNAKRDGKCLRYRDSWHENGFNRETFLKSLSANLEQIKLDISSHPTKTKPIIMNGDCRKILNSSKSFDKFKLCISSPPYLNTFDYTDIYRPELFLGKFVKTKQELRQLRLKTVRSHIQAKWELPKSSDFGVLYEKAIDHVNQNKENLMSKNIPLMIQAYFEDMRNVLQMLKTKADKEAQIWFVVSNSAYADMEIPVDLIIGDIGSQVGWYLKEIGVLRQLGKRKTKHSPNVKELRESVVIFSTCKN